MRRSASIGSNFTRITSKNRRGNASREQKSPVFEKII